MSVFNLEKSNVSCFIFYGSCFWCCISELFAQPKVTTIFSRFLLEVVYIIVYIKSPYRFVVLNEIMDVKPLAQGLAPS